MQRNIFEAITSGNFDITNFIQENIENSVLEDNILRIAIGMFFGNNGKLELAGFNSTEEETKTQEKIQIYVFLLFIFTSASFEDITKLINELFSTNASFSQIKDLYKNAMLQIYSQSPMYRTEEDKPDYQQHRDTFLKKIARRNSRSGGLKLSLFEKETSSTKSDAEHNDDYSTHESSLSVTELFRELTKKPNLLRNRDVAQLVDNFVKNEANITKLGFDEDVPRYMAIIAWICYTNLSLKEIVIKLRGLEETGEIFGETYSRKTVDTYAAGCLKVEFHSLITMIVKQSEKEVEYDKSVFKRIPGYLLPGLLRKQGYTISSIAQSLGISENHVRRNASEYLLHKHNERLYNSLYKSLLQSVISDKEDILEKENVHGDSGKTDDIISMINAGMSLNQIITKTNLDRHSISTLLYPIDDYNYQDIPNYLEEEILTGFEKARTAFSRYHHAEAQIEATGKGKTKYQRKTFRELLDPNQRDRQNQSYKRLKKYNPNDISHLISLFTEPSKQWQLIQFYQENDLRLPIEQSILAILLYFFSNMKVSRENSIGEYISKEFNTAAISVTAIHGHTKAIINHVRSLNNN